VWVLAVWAPAVWVLAVWGLTVLVLAGRSPAQAEVDLVDRNGERLQLRVEWTATSAARRPGGQGFLEVRLENGRSEPRAVEVEVYTQPFLSADLSARRLVQVPAEGRQRLFLPLIAFDQSWSLRLRVDGVDVHEDGIETLEADVAVLLVDRPDEAAVNFARSFAVEHRGSDPPLVQLRAPTDVPEQWSLLSGFDMVVVDGGEPDLSPALQEALRRYAAGGGALVVRRADELPGGRLREVCERAAAREDRTAVHGLGRVLAAESAWSRSWLLHLEAPSSGGRRAAGGPVPASLQAPWPIPGLDAVPVGMFFLLVLCFALLVGPVNLWILRKGRRPTFMVVTVPLLGLGFTVAILAWGMFREGFGTRGVARSLTVLDQVHREAVTVGSRTLYAGIGPSELALDAESYLFCKQALNSPDPGPRGGRMRRRGFRQRNKTHALSFDLGRSTVDGAVLPSRNPSTLVTATVATSRPRVGFRRQGEGFALVVADGLRPVDGSTVLLRPLGEGPVHAGVVDGDSVVLRPASAEQVRAAFERVLDGFDRRFGSGVDGDGEVDGEVESRPPPEPVHPLLIQWQNEGLPRGSYVMVAAVPPAWDDLGLDVAWNQRFHVVLGLCGEEDFDG